MGMLASCGSIDEPYSVNVRNNLSETVTLAVCDNHDCSRTVDPIKLRPSQVGGVDVEIDGGYGPAIIFDPYNRAIGCLPFRISQQPQTDITVNMSEAVPCDQSGGVDAARSHDWPDPKL